MDTRGFMPCSRGIFYRFKKQIQKCGNGNYADLAIFSFHPVKHIACGEGGMITTNDFDLCEKNKIVENPWNYKKGKR